MKETNRLEVAAAHEAGLRYVGAQREGIRRVRAGQGFRYVNAKGRRVIDTETLRRIRSLAIPPAWKDVWICPHTNGHIQATGRDDRKRKQYRYHNHWREVRDENKFNRMIAFGRALPRIRSRVRRDLRAQGLGRAKVLAAVVRLMDLSAIRIGNDEYAHDNKSYGLTTLRNHHATVNGSKIHLRFRGKSGKDHAITIEHPKLSRIVRRCQDLPGQELFGYIDESGEVRDVSSGDVNAYLLEISGSDFTSKDFRTWTGTVLAARALSEVEPAKSGRQVKRNIVHAIERVAERLGNTPAVCKKCYVHPEILESYRDGTLSSRFNTWKKVAGLPPEEATVVALLKARARRSAEPLEKRLKHSLKAASRSRRTKKSG